MKEQQRKHFNRRSFIKAGIGSMAFISLPCLLKEGSRKIWSKDYSQDSAIEAFSWCILSKAGTRRPVEAGA